MHHTVEDVIKNWPDEPRESATRLIEEYGPPAEFSSSLMIWRNTPDGWKRSELSSELTEHHFPAKHNDFLEQFVDYKVPVGMFSTLAQYDGSVVVDRTRGEMSARCGHTSMNFVAINLAHDIITGRRTVELARAEYSCLYEAYQNGEKPDYTQAFQFDLPLDDTKDPDVATLAEKSSGAEG